MSSLLVAGRYELCTQRLLGKGAFCRVYKGRIHSGRDRVSNTDVAIKIILEGKTGYLKSEATLLQQKLIGKSTSYSDFPEVYWQGTHESCETQVMQFLGPCLLDLFLDCGRCFSVKTVLMIAEQLISALEVMHGKGYLHRDVKPDNVCVGVGQNEDNLYLIDFGLSREYLVGGKHVTCTEKNPFQGNFYWASSNVLQGLTSSRRDDLESLMYTLFYFLRGELPWYVTHETRCSPEIVLDRRNRLSISDMCIGLPPVMATALTYVKNLAFNAVPKYDYLKKLFREAGAKLRVVYDNEFDWKYVIKDDTFMDCCLDDLNIMKSRDAAALSQDNQQLTFQEKSKRRSSFSAAKSTALKRRRSSSRSRRPSKRDESKVTLPKMLAALNESTGKSPGTLMLKCNSHTDSPRDGRMDKAAMSRPTAAHSTNEIYEVRSVPKIKRGTTFNLDLIPVPGDSLEDDGETTPKATSPIVLSTFRARYEEYKANLPK